MTRLRSRSGTTLVELIIFTAIFTIIGMALIPLLFLATENRVLQQTQALVETNGAQILQQVSSSILASERILAPSSQGSGSVLALQTASGSAAGPVIFGIGSGAFIRIQHASQEALSSPQVTVGQFSVRNTSTATSRSVLISFTVSRTTQISPAHIYSRRFAATFTLPPVDHFSGDPCGCALPVCNTGNHYQWQVCGTAGCMTVATQLECEFPL